MPATSPQTTTQRTKIGETIALLDLDNSLRDGWIVVDWALRLAEAGLLAQAVVVQVLGMVRDYRAGRLPYGGLAVSIPEAFARGLRGADVDEIAFHARVFAEGDRELRPFAYGLLSGLRQRGIAPILVSGAPEEVLEPVGRRLGAASNYGTVLAVRDGIYLGTLSVNRATEQEKQRVVEKLRTGSMRIELALGDSPADLPLLRAARVAVLVDGQGIADRLAEPVMLGAETGDVSSVWRQLDR